MLKKGGIRITLYSPRFLFLSSLKINLKTVRRMIEINHSCRAFLNNKGQVVIRVRWNNRKDEVGFSVGCNADPDKWDKENQRARYNTTHKVGGKTVVARDITIVFLNF